MKKSMMDPKIKKASAEQVAADLHNANEGVVLKPSSAFATPKDMKALMEYCDRFTGPGEKVIAYTIMGMTWNLAAKLTAPKVKA